MYICIICIQQEIFKKLPKTQLNFDMEKNSLTRVKKRLETINCLAIINDIFILRLICYR